MEDNKDENSSGQKRKREDGDGSETERSDPKRRKVKQILECPVCMHLMGPPIYQCKAGHLLCSACHAKVDTCPSCRVKLNKADPIRTLALEQLIEVHDIRYPCQNEERGCKERLVWGKPKTDHEVNCPHRLVACPFKIVNGCSDCQDTMKLDEIQEHCVKKHKSSRTFDSAPARVNFTVSNDNIGSKAVLHWDPIIIGKRLFMIARVDQSGFVSYARHISGDPIRYRLRFSQDGVDMSFVSTTVPVDHQDLVEMDKFKALAVHPSMIKLLQKDTSSVNILIEVQILD